MIDFTAIDFETANDDRSSACAVGIAAVRNGTIAEVWSSLIRPPTLEFRPDFIALHGITPHDVLDAPRFVDVWPEIHRLCDGRLVAAHNAAFDVSVLQDCTALYGLSPLSGPYVCTCQLAKRLVPELPHHRLDVLADYYGIPLDHHDPASDAVACAELGIRFAAMEGAQHHRGSLPRR